MNTYIQDKLDELVETYRRTTVIYEKQNGDEVKEKVNSYFTEYDARMIAERLVADYHNHIVEKIKNSDKAFGIIDKDGKGGAILITDIEKII